MIYIVFAILYTFIACNNQYKAQDFERSHELFEYLEKVQKMSFSTIDSSTKVFILLQAEFCGLCTDEAQNFLDDFLTQYPYDTVYLIEAKPSKTVHDRYAEHPRVIFKQDQAPGWSRYGLRLVSHLLFIIKQNKILDWTKLQGDVLEHTRKRWHITHSKPDRYALSTYMINKVNKN